MGRRGAPTSVSPRGRRRFLHSPTRTGFVARRANLEGRGSPKVAATWPIRLQGRERAIDRDEEMRPPQKRHSLLFRPSQFGLRQQLILSETPSSKREIEAIFLSGGPLGSGPSQFALPYFSEMSKRPSGEKLNAIWRFFFWRTTPYLDCARARLMGIESKEYNVSFPQRLYFCNPSPHLFDVHISGCAVGRGGNMQYRNTLMLFEETRIGRDGDFVLK